MPQMPKRDDVPEEQTWNLTDLFVTPEDFELALATFPDKAQSLRGFRGRLSEGATITLECLSAYLRIMDIQGHLYGYAFNRLSADGLSAENRDAHSRVMSMMTLAAAESAFIIPELLSLSEETLEGYMGADPGFAPWRRWLRNLILQRAHLLPHDTERAIASLGEVLWSSGQIYRTWRSTDLAFPSIQDSLGAVYQMSLPQYERMFERSGETTLRRAAYTALGDSLGRYRNTVATIWGTQVRTNIILARLRSYGSAIEMKLAEQEIPLDFYDRLHEVLLSELSPHMRKLASLRKKVLGLDRILYCDIEADLDPGYSPISSFEQARDAILDGLSPLGDEYVGVLKTAFRDRWIDWADNEGKTGDCYSGGGDPHPYVLVRWDGTMRSAMILAHELGHAVHQYLTTRNQVGYDRRTSLIMGEAASTTTEAIVGDWLMEHSDNPRARRWFIMHLLTSYYHNFVRHLIESELQRRVYAMAEKDLPVTADLLCRVQGDILSEFWGNTVDIDEAARLTWMRQVHYYDQRLYSWSYAGGLTLGVAVLEAIRGKDPHAAERWVRALKAGGSLPPLQLAERAGVDLSARETIGQAVKYVAALVDELDRSF